MHKYRLVAKKGEGTFSEVLKAQCIKNGKYVAIKCMKNHFDSLDQVNNLREIQALRRLSPHANIIKLLEVLYDQPTGRLALVFELMDMNIYELIRGRRHYVAEDRVKMYMYQLMKAMDHMHRNGIFHRDIKPENILIMDDCLKLADFGSCRGIYSKQPYTEYISTRWYRAPECLLTDGYYNYKMDMWGVGCVFFEIMSLFPLFPGTNELDQIQKIHNILGTPPPELLAKMKKRSQHMDFNFPPKEGTGIAKLIPHVSPDCVDLIVKLLSYNPDDRLSARQALRHPYFREIRDAEKRQKAMLNPEAPLSAQPSQTHAGVDDVKSARVRASPSNSEGGTTLTGTINSTMNLMSPRDNGRAGDTQAAALPSITKPAGGNTTYAASHAAQQHGHAPVHGAMGGGTLAGSLTHHMTGNHSEAGHHHRAPMGMTHGDGGEEGPLEISNSYRLQGLHAENSMEAMSAMQGDNGALPPIANLTIGKSTLGVGAQHSTRRTQQHYSEQHGMQQASYSKGKGGTKRSGVPSKYVQKPNMAGGIIGQGSLVAGHKIAPAGAPDLTGSGTQSTYKYKNTTSSKPTVPKYVSPYSLRQLVGIGKDN